jgi:hypothetical protein
VVEDRVDARRCQRADLGGDVAAVVDRGGAERGDDAGVARGRRADHPDPGRAGELHQRGADAAARAVHQDRAAGAHPGLAVEHLPGRDPVDHERFGVGGVEAVRHRHEVGGVQDDVAAPAADLGHRGHPAPDERRVGRLEHRADDVVAGHERERRLVVVLPAPHLLFGERDPAGFDAHEGLARTRRRQLTAGDPEAVRLDEAGEDDFGGPGHESSPSVGV